MFALDDLTTAARTTLTAMREPTDPDDDDIAEAQACFAATTTATKASGDNEDDRDDDDIVGMAGTTTLTESRGDHESDPDEDDAHAVEKVTMRGIRRPLHYRFAETGRSGSLNVRYDDATQVSVLRSGRSVVSALTTRI